ncbi:50S ribosomal protein L3 [bacterium]|nr:50S ribosomal protein L3 [bacterium]RQV99568.1 MAG: 50S ribosomal protein L3 [bacterium]
MTGLIGKKIGMTQIFEPSGVVIPVTVIELGPNQITNLRTDEKNGYTAICLGFGEKREKLIPKPVLGQYKKAGVTAPRVEKEFRDMELEEKKVGDILKCDLFTIGDKVTVDGVSKGRGFSGVIKRHGFARPKMTHGTHEFFRHGGSIGAHTDPGRVWKGKRMAGQYGCASIRVKNLKIVRVDVDANLIMVRGAVPGPNNGIVFVSK